MNLSLHEFKLFKDRARGFTKRIVNKTTGMIAGGALLLYCAGYTAIGHFNRIQTSYITNTPAVHVSSLQPYNAGGFANKNNPFWVLWVASGAISAEDKSLIDTCIKQQNLDKLSEPTTEEVDSPVTAEQLEEVLSRTPYSFLVSVGLELQEKDYRTPNICYDSMDAFEEYKQIETLADLMILDSQRKVKANNLDGYTGLINAVKIGNILTKDAPLQSVLLSYDIMERALYVIKSGLDHGNFAEDDAYFISSQLSKIELRPLETIINNHYQFTRQDLQHYFTYDGNFEGQSEIFSSSMAEKWFWNTSRSKTLKRYDEIMAKVLELSAKPYAEARIIPDLLQASNPFENLIFPEVAKVVERRARMQTLLAGVSIMGGLEGYKTEMRGYPETLESLAPNYLNAVANDIFSQKEPPLFSYSRMENSYYLYSFGPDIKDDGGRGKPNPFDTTQSDIIFRSKPGN